MKVQLLVLTSLLASVTLAAPQTGGLIVPSKPDTSTDNRQTRGFAFPDKTTTTSNRYRSPTGYQKTVETRQQELVATDPDNRQIGVISNFLANMPDLNLALDARVPFLRVPLSSLSRLTESASGLGTTSSSLLKLNMGTIAALAGIVGLATFFYPQIFSVLGLTPSSTQFRNSGEVTHEDIANNVNRVLERYNVDANSCMKLAMCTVGRSIGAKNQARAIGSGSTPLDLLDTVMNLTPIKDGLTKRGFRQARDFGERGGDCDSFNKENKCPMSAATWGTLLAKVF